MQQTITDGHTGLLQYCIQSSTYRDKEDALSVIARYESFAAELRAAGDTCLRRGRQAKANARRRLGSGIQEHPSLGRRRSEVPMKLFQDSRGVWFASFTDQKGKCWFISLKAKDGKVAEQIAEQIVPHELARTREPIHKEVVRYLEEKAELRRPNWTRDGGCVLRACVDE